MMPTGKNIKPRVDLSFLTLGEKYLHTTKNILDEIIKSGNSHFVSRTYTYDPLNVATYLHFEEEYEEITKRSDFNVLIPTLFLFYHGLELILKGILILQNQEIKFDHKISTLFNQTKEIIDNDILIGAIEIYLLSHNMTEVIKSFLLANNQTIDDFYIILRYPTPLDGQKIYNYLCLKYREDHLIPFVSQMKNDINTIMLEVVKIYNLTKGEHVDE